MSATNHTSTIELSQYVSTDKPTYLTDYNGDMLKIDNAIAADRDSITTAQNKANTADGKADANKLSIDTLNAQINGDPTDPSDTGLAGKVTDNSGDIDTIEALLGNGTPTTSNQTVIGAINGLEGAIAPREDGDSLANSYAEGEQFARGGSVYTALTSLTAGTAFASLTLNTDYKNSDTLVEQIADAETEIGQVAEVVTGLADNFVINDGDVTGVTFTFDGVDSLTVGCQKVHAAIDAYIAALADGEAVSINRIAVSVAGVASFVVEMLPSSFDIFTNESTSMGNRHFTSTGRSSSGDIVIVDTNIRDNASTPFILATFSNGVAPAIVDKKDIVPANTDNIKVHFTKYKKI